MQSCFSCITFEYLRGITCQVTFRQLKIERIMRLYQYLADLVYGGFRILKKYRYKRISGSILHVTWHIIPLRYSFVVLESLFCGSLVAGPDIRCFRNRTLFQHDIPPWQNVALFMQVPHQQNCLTLTLCLSSHFYRRSQFLSRIHEVLNLGVDCKWHKVGYYLRHVRCTHYCRFVSGPGIGQGYFINISTSGSGKWDQIAASANRFLDILILFNLESVLLHFFPAHFSAKCELFFVPMSNLYLMLTESLMQSCYDR